jgi:hypothetical protein
MRDCQMYSRKVTQSKTIINLPIKALCLKYRVLMLYHPGNILFQIMLVISDVLFVPNILDPLAIFRIRRSYLTSLRILRRVANE